MELKEFEETVWVSKEGKVFREIKPFNRGNKIRKYLCVMVNGKKWDIHRLVATVYLENPESKPCVLHYDDNSLNNHINNLRWGSYKENTMDARRNGLLRPRGKRNLRNKEKYAIYEQAKKGYKYKDIAKNFGVGESRVSQIIKELSNKINK